MNKLALASVLGSVLAASTLAGIADAASAPVIDGKRYVEKVFVVCNGKTNCFLNFSAVPAAKHLLITNTACSANMVNTTPLYAVNLGGRKADGTSTAQTSFVMMQKNLDYNGSTSYRAQEEMAHLLLTGEKPEILMSRVGSTGEFMASCSISGVLE